MIEIAWTLEGYFALLADPKRDEKLRRAARKAQKEEASDYNVRRQSPALRDRFSKQKGSRFGFARRSIGYERRQRKFYGRVIPYRSPRPHGMRGGPHMDRLIVQPKRGWRVSAVNKGTAAKEVRARMRYPGAKVLNLLGRNPQTQKYRDEFLRMEHPSHRRDARAINEGIGKRYLQSQREIMNKQPKRRLKAAAATIDRAIGG